MSADSTDVEVSSGSESDAAQSRSVQLSMAELSAGVFSIILWFFLFSGGLLVSTQPHRDVIQNSNGNEVPFRSWFIVIAFWTVTNVGLLSCVSAYLGALGKRARFTHQTDQMHSPIDATRDHHDLLWTYYLSAVLRGFGVYTLLLGGLLVLATSSLVTSTQGDYMRLAPTLSIISFYAGYDPSVFSGLLEKVNSFLKTKSNR